MRSFTLTMLDFSARAALPRPETRSTSGQPVANELTSTNAADKDLNIELMNERAAMLADVADQVLLTWLR